jgi:hypothetical protein
LKGIAQSEIANCQKQAGTDFPVIITDSGISTALVSAAMDTKADLVLIGRGHAQKFLGRFRTHTYELLSQLHCPVFSYCHEQAAEVMEAIDAAKADALHEVLIGRH